MKAMRLWLLVLMLASATYSQMPPIEPGVSQDLAKWRAARYSDIHYKLNLTLEKMSPALRGTIEIRVKVSEPGATATGFLPPIVLDWRKITGHEKDSTISNVSINGNSVENHPVGETPTPLLRKEGSLLFEEANDHLIFRDGVVMGENAIKLDFTSPILTSGSATTRYIDKEDGSEYIYSLFVPSDASTAFPVFDQPDLKARFSLCVDAPKDWHLASNEAFPGYYYMDAAEPTNWFCLPRETKPISTYAFSFAAGPFAVFNEKGPAPSEPIKEEKLFDGSPRMAEAGVPWTKYLAEAYIQSESSVGEPHIYVRKSQAQKFKPHAAEVFRLTSEGIKYLEQYFDFKFPFPKLDLVLIPEFPFGGMEHAGAIFLREDRVIFPQEPTKNDYITRANLIFHETAHQWFGDTVTMKWFDDLWLKEGFAEFMAYKTLEKVMPEYNAWKVFYERNKQAAYLTDSTKGTTPIYQPVANLSAAKSAYGNIVYRKAPSFLRQAEFYLGEDKFQTAVRAFLKKHEFANATWEDLVKEFETVSGMDLKEWATQWVKQRGMPIYRSNVSVRDKNHYEITISATDTLGSGNVWGMKAEGLLMGHFHSFGPTPIIFTGKNGKVETFKATGEVEGSVRPFMFFPNDGDYGYGTFLLDAESRDDVLKNIQNEKDDFLRSMMWGSLWDSVREAELDPKAYVDLVVKNIGSETDESTVATLLSRASTALNYYMPAEAERVSSPHVRKGQARSNKSITSPTTLGLRTRFEELLLDKLQHASTPGQRITYYRAYVGTASTEKAHEVLKQMLEQASVSGPALRPRTKDKFDIVTRLIILGDPEASKLLAGLEKTETSDEAKRYAYAARAAFATAENKSKYWNDFVNNKEISESWIESAILPFNSLRQSDLTLPYLERSLAELPNLKRSRKIFFVNNWLGAFIPGQRSEQALAIVNKFLASNPNLDRDLQLKILENVDLIERAVKIRTKFASK